MNNKIYRIGFFVLLIINVALIIVFTQKTKPRKRPKPFKEEIAKKLQFDEGQKVQFEEMAQAHRNKMQDIRRREHKLISEYFGPLKKASPSEEDTLLLEEIGNLQIVKTKVTFDHFKDLKAICRADQLSQYDSLVTGMTQLIIGRRRPPRPRR